MRTWIIPAASCSRAVAVCAKCAQQTSTRLFGTAPISRRPWIQALEKTAGSGLAELRRHTQNSPGFGPWGFDSPSRHQDPKTVSQILQKRVFMCPGCLNRLVTSVSWDDSPDRLTMTPNIRQGISFSASKTANILNQVTFRGMVESDFHRQLLPTSANRDRNIFSTGLRSFLCGSPRALNGSALHRHASDHSSSILAGTNVESASELRNSFAHALNANAHPSAPA